MVGAKRDCKDGGRTTAKMVSANGFCKDMVARLPGEELRQTKLNGLKVPLSTAHCTRHGC